MGHLCEFSVVPGRKCGAPAPHLWGGLHLCCSHFDGLVATMSELREAIHDRIHQDFVENHDLPTHQSARLHVVPNRTYTQKIDPEKKSGDT
jgi:hypothetical protein